MINDKNLKLKKLGNNLKTYFGKPANVVTIVFLIVLTITVVAPLFTIVIDSFRISTVNEARVYKLPLGKFTGLHWSNILFNKTHDYSKNAFWKPLGNSIAMALVACLVAVVGGGVTAWFITRSNLPFKKFISTVFVFPYVMPSWSIAMFWENFFKNTNLTTDAKQVGMLQMITGGAEHGLCVPQWMVYGFLPTAMCLGIHYAPFAYILIGGILRNMDANLEEAATVLKAGRGKILGRITLPIVAPALISTVLLVFSSSISSYTVPAFLNRDGKFTTISTQLRSVAGDPGTRGRGYVIAIILLLFSVAILTLNNWFTGKRKSFTTVSGKSGQASLVKLGKVWRWVFAVLIIIVVVFTAIMPLVSFALESFCPNGEWTLYYWTTMDRLSERVTGDKVGILHNGTIWKSFGYSIGLSLCVAMIAGTCGILVGYAVSHKRGSKLATLVSNMAFFPYLIPALSFGAIYLSVSSSVSFLSGSFILLLLVGGVKFLPFASRTGTNAMLQVSGEIEEAAVMMNANWGKRMTRILFPIQKSSFMSGYLLPFISCMREMSLFVLLAPAGSLLTVVLQDWTNNGLHGATPVANGINLIIIVTILLFQFIINKLTGASLDKGIGG
ncbi:MAG: iron ABC transporter permease [Corallococcus sp.]|nr:iron ABC transporter permease [Bacillota bacterium]MCM1533504.1 iron ABC transporter permease [Corallococcus sp.]